MMERRRASYYLDAPDRSAPLGAPAREPKPLYGAAAIADYLKLRDAKQVYRLVEANQDIPIRKLPGIGLATDEEALSEWWDRVIIRGMAS
jgi:hypothetical protein